MNNQKIKVEVEINAPVEKVWEFWTNPKDIVSWNFASDDWCCLNAENDLVVGGKFGATMSSTDKSVSFNFNGVYDEIILHKKISYSVDPMYYKQKNIDGGRKVDVEFVSLGNKTKVIETFDPEEMHSRELQQQGWQAILNNFKKYVETNMERLHFEIEINSPVEHVFKTMLGNESYQIWTKTFNPTSNFKGNWEKGNKILFFGTDDKGNLGGMVSKIKENIPNKFVSIAHQGILEGDKEITSGPQADLWKNATENYTFIKKENKTILVIDTDTIKDYSDYFKETWPKALETLKKICEE